MCDAFDIPIVTLLDGPTGADLTYAWRCDKPDGLSRYQTAHKVCYLA
jgi:hypothetical protein